MPGTSKESNSVNKAIGLIIKRERLLRGWSRTQLGKPLGITQQQVEKYESGKNRISVGKLAQISKIMQKPIIQFFEEINMVKDVKEGSRFHIEMSRMLEKIDNPDHQRAIHYILKGFIINKGENHVQ